jgi:hypothetical protein
MNPIGIDPLGHGGPEHPNPTAIPERAPHDVPCSLECLNDALAALELKTLKHAAVSNLPDGTNTEHAEIRERAGIRPGDGTFMALARRQRVTRPRHAPFP